MSGEVHVDDHISKPISLKQVWLFSKNICHVDLKKTKKK